jgi:hypothetical protein
MNGQFESRVERRKRVESLPADLRERVRNRVMTVEQRRRGCGCGRHSTATWRA